MSSYIDCSMDVHMCGEMVRDIFVQTHLSGFFIQIVVEKGAPSVNYKVLTNSDATVFSISSKMHYQMGSTWIVDKNELNSIIAKHVPYFFSHQPSYRSFFLMSAQETLVQFLSGV